MGRHQEVQISRDHFDNGVLIPDLARWYYRGLGADAGQFGNPYATGTTASYFDWLTEELGAHPQTAYRIPRLWYFLYQQDPQLQRRFPDVWGSNYSDFCRWVLREGVSLYAVPERFTLTLQRALLTEEHTTRKAARSPVMAVDGVNIAGHFSSEKGVGEAVRSATLVLAAAKIPYVLNNFVDPGSANNDTTFTQYADDNPYTVNLLTLGAGEVAWFAQQKRDKYFRDRYTIGHWAWELADFPPQWTTSFRYVDEVWVASSFIQHALAAIAPVPVITIPYAITDVPPPPPTHRLFFGLPQDSFIFLTAFDFNSYTERKNPLATIEAFRRAFKPEEPVHLVVKCVHSQVAPADLRAIQDAAQGVNVQITDRILPRRELRRLFAMADCYVSLHRAEGFGLTIAEAMSFEKPVIATGFSGNMDFMSEENSYPCHYGLVPIEHTHGPYHRGFVWAEPDLDHAAHLMRDVYECIRD